MTGNRDSSPPAKAREDEAKPRSMPPPPPVRRRSAGPPPPPVRAAASPAPRAAASQPPPPPKRTRPPAPSTVSALASGSLPPPPIPTLPPPSLPPVEPPVQLDVVDSPAPVQLDAIDTSAPVQLDAADAPAPVQLDVPDAPPEAESKPLAVEQALALEHALDKAREELDTVREEEVVEAPQQAPRETAHEFGSPHSEMPVVLTTPVPRERETRPPQLAQLWHSGREWFPRAHSWSQKTLRAAPRALVVTAPFIALFGIWLAHSVVTHHRRAVPAAAPLATHAFASQPAQVTPAVTSLASAFLAATASSAAPAATATPALPSATPAELARAIAHGLPATEALAAKFPSDAQVGIALAGQQAQAQRYEAAVATVEHVLSVTPSSAQNGKLLGILWRAAQSPASEQSFLSLRKLAGRGSDVAFDLATTPGVRESVRERARAELTNYLAFDASDDTRVATALLLAPDCSTRKSLLDRAEREGGKRTLAMLERFGRGAGCTSSSDGACNSCLMGSPVLAHALARLSAGGKP